MYIKKLLSLLISLFLIVSTFAACRSIDDNALSSGNISDISSETYGIVDVIDDNSDIESTESVVSDDTQSDVSSDIEDDSNVNSEIENVVSVGDGDTNADPDAPLTFIEPDPEKPDETTNSDSSTTGYDKITCNTSPNYKTGDVVTVKIAANGSVFYKIKGASNKILTINNSNAYVIYDNTKYEAKNGVISFLVKSDELASAQIMFEIGNKGTTAESFTINFASPKGSWDNKEKIDIVGKEISTALAEGEESGYWYQFTATKAGTLKLYLLSGTDTGILVVTNNRNYAQRSTESEDELKSDSVGKYIELTGVEKGDEIVINLGAKSSGGKKYPAVTLKWKIEQ